jgi:hypothetical protein
VLLSSLNPAAVAGGHDIEDAVRFGDVTLSRSDVVGAATSVAERVGGADRVASTTPARRRGWAQCLTIQKDCRTSRCACTPGRGTASRSRLRRTPH